MTAEPSTLAKRKSDNELMPPPLSTKRIKRPTTVLEEDTYSDALSHIIARDFFPGLLELESQEEYLDALKAKDDTWIENAGRKLIAAMTPRPGRRRGTDFESSAGILNTPRTLAQVSGTPAQSSNTVIDQPAIKPDLNLSLQGFLSKYTSEDAESFNKLLDKQNQEKTGRHAWLHNDNKIPEPRQIAYRKQQQKLLEASASEEASDGRVSGNITGLDDRPSGPKAWKHVGKNSFMFRPDSIEDSFQTIQQKSEEISRAAPKQVIYGNTRIASLFSGAPEESVPPSPTLSAIKDAIAGRPRIHASEGGYDGSETPRVNGYAFVDSEEPEPTTQPPHRTDWSQISFGNVDSKRNPFSMQESSTREQLHHRLVDRAAQSKRKEKLVKDMRTPVVGAGRKGSSTPVPFLTPAGHRLLGRLGGTTPLRSSLNTSNIWEGDKGKTPRGPHVKGLMTPQP